MIIELTRGFVTHVDDEDYDVLMHFSWYAAKCGEHIYAQGHVYGQKRYMHRFLMGEPVGIEIDHADQDDLNNRRRNLRFAGHHQNLSNRGLQRNNTLGFKGIAFHRNSGLWGVRVKHKGFGHSVGYHATPEEAARYYNLKAAELYGEFACFNEVEPRFPVIVREMRSGLRVPRPESWVKE